MTEPIEIIPFSGAIEATIQPPGSKSITNRALLCAALAEGTSKLFGALDSDDTRVMIDSLRQLGVDIIFDDLESEIVVVGCGGSLPNESAELFVRNSGTSIRFLTAMLGMHGGQFRLAGDPRMHERPIGDLADALNQLGANVVAESERGCPPVVIASARVAGGSVSVRGNISSQYLSGLMMAAPLATATAAELENESVPTLYALLQDVKVVVEGQLVSIPYVTMTAEVMKSFGVNCRFGKSFEQVIVPVGQGYQATEYSIEPDASAASYFFGAAAICGGTARVTGLGRNALQGDVAFAKALAGTGCEVSFEEDSISVTGPATKALNIHMGDFSDTAQTFAVVALFLPESTTISGIAHNRVKETDRIGDLATELRKLGAKVDETDDGMVIHPPSTFGGKLVGAEIETYDDHRMAMSLSLAGLKIPGVTICDPGCVSKTYPKFFEDLEAIRP